MYDAKQARLSFIEARGMNKIRHNQMIVEGGGKKVKAIVDEWYWAADNILVRNYDIPRLEHQIAIAGFQGKDEAEKSIRDLAAKLKSELSECESRLTKAKNALIDALPQGVAVPELILAV